MEGYPRSITYDCGRQAFRQMETSICKVHTGQEQATGFFCKIPFPTKEKMLPVFITNNHVINDQLLNQNNATISIYKRGTRS